MNQVFNFELYKDLDLYHVKYGRGAVIVAAEKKNAPEKHDSPKRVAAIFNSRDRQEFNTCPPFDPVSSIEEIDGLVYVRIALKYRNSSNPSYYPVDGTIERILPIGQVTLEVVRSNEDQ